MSVRDVPVGKVSEPVAPAPDDFSVAHPPDPLTGRTGGYVGTPVSRVDGPRKVTGAAPFAAEFRFDRMAYAALAYSTIPKGRIATLDVRAAEESAGVVLVMTYRNAPRMSAPPVFLTSPKAAAGSDLPIMQDDRIHWNGQPIAVVLAETQEDADRAAALIRCAYDPEPASVVFDDVKGRARPASFAGEALHVEIGDAEAALAVAPYAVDATYRTPRHNHNPIEPHAATVAWRGEDLIVHDAAQGVAHAAWTLAQIFGIDEARVHVTSPFVGGGFGSKTIWQHQVLAAAAAKIAERPVRLALSREGVYRIVGGRTLTEQRVAIAALESGRFEALIHTGVSAMTAHNALPEAFITPAMCLYRAASFKLDVKVADLDMLANTFMRAPGESVGSFALESAVDELAERLGIDPIELRVRNDADADPISGKPFSSRHLIDAYRLGAERFGWRERGRARTGRREGEWLVGTGVATATYPYNRMPGAAARLTLAKDGRVTAGVAAHEMGMGTATVTAQVVADRLGVPLDRVTVEYGDSSLPGVILAGGSQQTAAVGGAIIAAERELVAALLRLVPADSPLAGLAPDEVGARDSALCALARPDRCESYATILGRAGRDEVTVRADAADASESERWSMHSFGAMFCEVRVNAVTGEPRVSRFLGSFDCGRIVNPKTAASQFRGGIIMGLGLALLEETQFDERNGRVMNPSLGDYHVPAHMDVPEIDVMWTDIPDLHAPMGAHGVGEIGITGVGAAVANAIYDATGKRVRDLPITLDKLL